MSPHHENALHIAPLPPYRRLLGPVTQSRIGRLILLYLILLVAGAALVAFAQHDRLRILGLGFAFPGAGFLAHAQLCGSGMSHLVSLLLALGVFGLALVLWFGTGNILAPPLAWLASAVAAAATGEGMRPGAEAQVAGAVGAAAVLLTTAAGCWFIAARRQRARDNDYLVSMAAHAPSIFSAALPPEQAEMTHEHLQRLRFALDRALQPLDQFNGFEKLDQFQTAAMRYQLNFLAYGVALTQARFTPAFSGYMHAAQIALLDKQRQHRVWKYWQLENLWGNLRASPDPTARENIMFTGFVALQMALFSASTGRQDFSQTGRFTMTHPCGQRYAHDAPSLVGSMQRAFWRSGYHLIACEPNWIYPLCNAIGVNAILALDAQDGGRRWGAHASDFRHHLETEFLDGFGRYIPCRSARTGLPFPALGGVMPLAMPCFFLNPIAPDLARRQWLLLRRRLFDAAGTFQRRAFWPIDTGNYGFSRAAAYAATALAAAELGDQRVRHACMQALEDECPSVLKEGVIHRHRASVWAHGVELMARAGGRNAFSAIIKTPGRQAGPRLEGLVYPDVLVAGAHADSSGLKAVLFPGREEGAHKVGLAGLALGTTYHISGALDTTISADAQGQAQLIVMLSGRTELTVRELR